MKVSRRAKPVDKLLTQRMANDGYKFDENGIVVRKTPWKKKQREREDFPLQLTIPKPIKLPPVPKTGRGSGRKQILLTDVRAEKLLAGVRIGLHKPQIAALGGITRESLHKWLTKGQENIKAEEEGRDPEYWEGFTIFAKYFEEAEQWIEIYMVKKMFEGAHYSPEAAERFLARRFPERWGKVPGQDGNVKPSDINLNVGVDFVTMLSAAHQQIEQRKQGVMQVIEVNGRVLPSDPRPPRALAAQSDTGEGRKT